MKNNQTKILAIKLKSTLQLIFILSFFLSLSFLTACSTDKIEPSYITFNNPATAFKQQGGSMARAAHANTIDSLIISIKNINDRTLSTTETFTELDTVKLTVPSNVSLIVSATAFANGEAIFSGEVTIDPVRAGDVSSLTLLLYDLTADSIETPVELSFNNTTLLGKSQGSAFSRSDDFVLFLSDNNNLVNGDTNESTDVFIRNFASTDTSSAVKNLHSDAQGNVANQGNVTMADISADGIYAVYSSTATNLVANDTNAAADIFLKNTITGDIQLISNLPTSNNGSFNPQITDDGRFITFYSSAENIETDRISSTIFAYNRITKTLVALALDFPSLNYRLSGDGKFIVFQSTNPDNKGLMIEHIIMPGSDISDDFINNSDEPILSFIDTKTRLIQSKPISRDASNDTDTDTDTQTIVLSDANFIFNVSLNGQYTVFIPQTSSGNLIENQIYLYNSETKKISLLSNTRTNNAFNGTLTQSGIPALSSDGQYLVFSYDESIYILNIKYKNLLELRNGRDPFINAKGDKIGYVFEDRIYILDNPLYITETSPSQKPEAPTNVFADQDGAIYLSWDENTNATFYRVYQSDKPNILDQLNASSSSISIIETNRTFIQIEDTFPNADSPFIQYFIVLAVNENGESNASVEVTNGSSIIDGGDITSPPLPNILANEGIEESPIVIDLVQGSQGGPHEGFVGTGKSYYSVTFNLPSGITTKAIYLDNASGNFSVSATSTDDVQIDCATSNNTCIIKDIIGTATITFIVDGFASEDGGTFTINEANVLMLSAQTNTPLSFNRDAPQPFVLISNLEVNERYLLRDDTESQFMTYPVKSLLNDDETCEIVFVDTLTSECFVSSNINAEILLDFTFAPTYGSAAASRSYTFSYVPPPLANEGSPTAPLDINFSLNQVFNYYEGTVGLEQSYYSRTFEPTPNTTLTKAIFIDNTDLLNVTITGISDNPDDLNNSAIIDCSTPSICLIKGITSSTTVTFIVNGSATEAGATFGIQEASVEIISSQGMTPATFSSSGSSPFLLITGLTADNKYLLKDTTINSPNNNYFIDSKFETLSSESQCEIAILDDARSCIFSTGSKTEILLDLSYLIDESGSSPSLTFSLDNILTKAITIDPPSNSLSLNNNGVVQFTDLDISKNYYLSLTALSGESMTEINYKVAAALPQRYNLFCSGLLATSANQINQDFLNDVDSCAFTPNNDGTVTTVIDYLLPSDSSVSVKIEIFELDTAIIPFDIASPTSIEINDRIMFLKLTNASQFESDLWLSIAVNQSDQFYPSQGFSATIKAYDSLENGPQCTSEMQSLGNVEAQLTPATCELRNTTSHLIALEFPEYMTSFSEVINTFDLGITPIIAANSIMIDKPATAINISPITYLEGDFGGVNSRYEDTMILATNSSNRLEISAYRSEWRREACTSVSVGSSVICITNRLYRGTLDFKISNKTNNAGVTSNVSIITPVTTSIGLNTTLTGEAINQDYVIYKFQNLDFTDGLIITVANTNIADPNPIPFTVVPNIGGTALCSNIGTANQTPNISCKPDFSINDDFRTSSGYIIIDTSMYAEGVAYDVSLSFSNVIGDEFFNSAATLQF